MKATRICEFPDCGRKLAGHGLCDSHLAQIRRGAELSPIKSRRSSCSVDGCSRRHHGHGYCEVHLKRWKRYGDPTGGLIVDPMERFLHYVEKTDTCWLWTGSLDTYGYGRIRRGDGVRVPAHRFAYEQFVGPIDAGLHIDHLCRVRHCVNPAHLEPVTPKENDRRGRMAAEMGEDEFSQWARGRIPAAGG